MPMTTAAYSTDKLPGETVDAVVIGGGAAGLNGALMLARSRRSVVVIDSGTPRNAPAAGVHGLLGSGRHPAGRSAAEGSRRGTRVRRPDRGRRGHLRPPRGPVLGGRLALRRHPGRRPHPAGAPPADRHRTARCAARGPRSRRALGTQRRALPVLPRLGGTRRAHRDPGRRPALDPPRAAVPPVDRRPGLLHPRHHLGRRHPRAFRRPEHPHHRHPGGRGRHRRRTAASRAYA